MTSPRDGRSAAGLRGSQEPRVLTGPSFASSAGDEAVELARHAGLILDPWQQLVLRQALGEGSDGRWAAFEVALVVSRQNGKGSILEARELAGLFLFGENLILHSAHEYKTAAEAFLRLRALIENAPDLMRRVKSIRTSHGEEGIELKSGQRIRFVARSKGSGRGFSADCAILDEAMILDDRPIGALMPTMSARPNPQLWYTASAGDLDSVVLGRVVRRGRAGDPSLAYMEWSVPHDENSRFADLDLDDPAGHAQSNPGVGYRISLEHIARERAAMDAAQFARERLGVGTYPSEDGDAKPIPPAAWLKATDAGSQIQGGLAFGIDMPLDHSWTYIGAAGTRPDGRGHGELIEKKPGTQWVVARALELRDRWSPKGFVVDPGGPAGSLIPELSAAGVPVLTVTARELAQGCGALRNAVVDEDSFRHRGQSELNDAIRAAKAKPLSDAWVFQRKAGGAPLLAVVLARHGAALAAPSIYEDRELLVL